MPRVWHTEAAPDLAARRVGEARDGHEVGKWASSKLGHHVAEIGLSRHDGVPRAFPPLVRAPDLIHRAGPLPHRGDLVACILLFR